MMSAILDKSFYRNTDVVKVAQNLLGKKLCTYIDGIYTAGIIVETEAYKAPEDAASHAFGNRRTTRTEIMFADGGMTYVYLIYGMYKVFNIITNVEDIPHAVLIRAIEPLEGIDAMLVRRKLPKIQKNLCNGPGLYTQALGIELLHTGIDVCHSEVIWIEDYKNMAENEIEKSPRVGLGKAVFEPYRNIPWRFYIKNNEWVSKPK